MPSWRLIFQTRGQRYFAFPDTQIGIKLGVMFRLGNKSMKRPLIAFVLVAILAGLPATAHHSFARFYFEDESVSIEGELFEVKLRSPHAWLYVMAQHADGETELFAAEWANANRLRRQGITEDTLRPGDHVIVTGSPGRGPSNHQIHLSSIERPADGWTWRRERR